jgi:hypothetical protein
MCSFCKSVEVQGRWCQVEEAVAALRFFEINMLPSVTHGVCSSCYQRAMALLGD